MDLDGEEYPLHSLCNGGPCATGTLSLLLNHNSGTQSVDDLLGRTPLHVAACAKDLQAARLLLQFGAKPNARDKSGKTPLMLACEKPNIEMIDLLISDGASVETVDKHGNSALHYVCGAGWRGTGHGRSGLGRLCLWNSRLLG